MHVQIKTFSDGYRLDDLLTTRVNRWLQEQKEKITVKDVKFYKSDNVNWVAIVIYEVKE
jgi:hypothetical protein